MAQGIKLTPAERQQRKAERRRNQRAQYAQRKADKVCTECARQDDLTMSGGARCQACKDRDNATRNKRLRVDYTTRKSLGLCVTPYCDNDPVPGRVRCARCLEVQDECGKKRRDEHLARGLCRCGRERVQDRHACARCLRQGLINSMTYQIRNGMCKAPDGWVFKPKKWAPFTRPRRTP